VTTRSLAWAALLALAACASPEPVTPTPPRRSAPGRVTARLLVVRESARAALVTVRVDVEPGWRIYGLTSPFGVPPRLELAVPRGVGVSGPLREPPASSDVALDDLPITVHRGQVTFTQRLALADDGPVSLGATFTWQVCDDDDTFCAPGRADATLVIAGADGRAPGPWELGDERASVVATLDPADEPGQSVLRVVVNGRADWWVQPLPLEVDAPPGVEQRPVDPLAVLLIVGREVGSRPVHLTVRWRGRTAAGTPGEGSLCASLPIPPPWR
jgi:DsbC/DsbD-like thiol-disulfide interchange protein